MFCCRLRPTFLTREVKNSAVFKFLGKSKVVLTGAIDFRSTLGPTSVARDPKSHAAANCPFAIFLRDVNKQPTPLQLRSVEFGTPKDQSRR